MKKFSEKGFSLVEMAIVMVIIGLIVAAVTVGKSTMQSAETLKVYQKIVVPCVAAVSEGIRNGAAATEPNVPSMKLGGNDVTCSFAAEAPFNTVTISGATGELKSLMSKNLANPDVTIEDGTVTLYVPGGA